MRDTDLFRLALGIEPPWVVTKSDFDAAAKRLDIHLDFAKSLPLRRQGAAGSPVRDAALRAVRPTTARRRPGGT
jgi:hypothetical protein